VKAADTKLLRHLETLGLVPGAEIEVREYSPFDHNLTVTIGQKPVVLGLNVTSKIYIEES
jgi:Fe2+ transport system protein FeoA